MFANSLFLRKLPSTYLELDHSDGIGTKGYFHWQQRTFKAAVQDALAMNLNDLHRYRACPYKLQNHLILPQEDLEAVQEIATTLADYCCQHHITITGGECAIHNDISALEISITLSSYTERDYPNNWPVDTLLLGWASSGLHANGFTYVRQLMQRYGYQPSLTELVRPTTIYKLPPQPQVILGLQHITGAAFTKLIPPPLQPVDLIIINKHHLRPQPIFYDIYAYERDDTLMYRTFNCGIGMVLAVAATAAAELCQLTGAEVIGDIRPGNGKVIIESMFSNKIVEFSNSPDCR